VEGGEAGKGRGGWSGVTGGWVASAAPVQRVKGSLQGVRGSLKGMRESLKGSRQCLSSPSSLTEPRGEAEANDAEGGVRWGWYQGVSTVQAAQRLERGGKVVDQVEVVEEGLYLRYLGNSGGHRPCGLWSTVTTVKVKAYVESPCAISMCQMGSGQQTHRRHSLPAGFRKTLSSRRRFPLTSLSPPPPSLSPSPPEAFLLV
jgi:hypothetical protein